jgi:outer membrane lipoprotein LolB
MIETVSHYTHEAMFEFSARNNSRMLLVPLATIHLIRPVAVAFRLCTLWLALHLVGCAALAPQQSAPDADFAVQGKLILSQGGDKAAMRFAWQQTQQDYVIDVWGALGQGRVQLRGKAEVLQVVRGKDVIAAGNPERIMQSQLGWSIPLGAIRYWLLGQPAPNTSFANYSAANQGRSVGFEQNSWEVRVELERSETASSQGTVPIELELVREDSAVRIRVSKYTRNMR